jgi:hypothetical protein
MADTLQGADRAALPLAGRHGRRWAGVSVFAVAGVVLFVAYYGLSRSYPENSDEANILLMAHDMLHGNLLLHGWYLSDVSFITTELPQYAVLEEFFGWGWATAHIAAAMTFTLVVGTGALLARGPRGGTGGSTAGWARMALTGGIMFAPQTGLAVFVLLLSVGHIGTAVPVMLAWLLIDRLGERWYVPVGVALLLAWAAVADSLVLVIAVWPLMLVSLVRMTVGARRLRELPGRRWFELSLFAAGAAGWLIAAAIARLVTNAGGYYLNAIPYELKHPAGAWWGQARVTWNGLRTLFGVNVTGQHVAGVALAALHVAGLVLALCGVLVALRRFLSWPGDVVSQVLVVAILANLAAYIPSTLGAHSASNVREVAPVLPFAAVLAGRHLGDRLAAWASRFRFVVPVLGIVLTGYVCTLTAGALSPAAPQPYGQAAAWLEAHHLRYGLAGYWQASAITVDTGGGVTVRAVTSCVNIPYRQKSGTTLFGAAIQCAAPAGPVTGGACEITPYPWETNSAWYKAGRSTAMFLLLVHDQARYSYDPPGPFNLAGGALALINKTTPHYPSVFIGRAGPLPYPPWHATYEVRVYKSSLLTGLPALAPPQACQ